MCIPHITFRGAGTAQWPGFDSRTRCHMWVKFVVGSRLWYFGFPLSSKTNISKFQFDLESEDHRFVSRKDC